VAKSKAFTLIELLVVISIIILVLAVMVPTIKTLTGNHSLALAQNRLTVMLAAAREAAIDNQQVYGLAIYPDITTGDTMLGFVQGTAQGGGIAVDIVSGTEQSTIQRGVTAQLVIGTPATTPPTRPGDRYAAIGFVLFDSHGHLYVTTAPTPSAAGPIGNVGSAGVLANSQLGYRFQIGGVATLPIFAGTGFALFDSDTFHNQVGNGNGGINPSWYEGGTVYYPLIAPGPPFGSVTVNGALIKGLQTQAVGVANEDSPYNTTGTAAKEQWMDTNGLLLMVNQFTGQLVEGQI
jgi:type II secretory pathway pseudopilin PulG